MNGSRYQEVRTRKTRILLKPQGSRDQKLSRELQWSLPRLGAPKLDKPVLCWAILGCVNCKIVRLHYIKTRRFFCESREYTSTTKRDEWKFYFDARFPQESPGNSEMNTELGFISHFLKDFHLTSLCLYPSLSFKFRFLSMSVFSFSPVLSLSGSLSLSIWLALSLSRSLSLSLSLLEGIIRRKISELGGPNRLVKPAFVAGQRGGKQTSEVALEGSQKWSDWLMRIGIKYGSNRKGNRNLTTERVPANRNGNPGESLKEKWPQVPLLGFFSLQGQARSFIWLGIVRVSRLTTHELESGIRKTY